jgi:hypothetical protein
MSGAIAWQTTSGPPVAQMQRHCLAARATIALSPYCVRSAMPAHSTKALQLLKTFGLSLPGTQPKSPWPGHDDVAVNNKTFAYLSAEGGGLAVSVKLPVSGAQVLSQPFAAPTGVRPGQARLGDTRVSRGRGSAGSDRHAQALDDGELPRAGAQTHAQGAGGGATMGSCRRVARPTPVLKTGRLRAHTEADRRGP